MKRNYLSGLLSPFLLALHNLRFYFRPRKKSPLKKPSAKCVVSGSQNFSRPSENSCPLPFKKLIRLHHQVKKVLTPKTNVQLLFPSPSNYSKVVTQKHHKKFPEKISKNSNPKKTFPQSQTSFPKKNYLKINSNKSPPKNTSLQKTITNKTLISYFKFSSPALPFHKKGPPHTTLPLPTPQKTPPQKTTSSSNPLPLSLATSNSLPKNPPKNNPISKTPKTQKHRPPSKKSPKNPLKFQSPCPIPKSSKKNSL